MSAGPRPSPSLFPQTPRQAAARAPVFCFAIQAEAEPGVMPRVLELLTKRGLVPLRWHADRVGPGGGELSIDLQVTGLEAPVIDYIARCLRQVPGVETVLTSEKALA